MRPHTTAQIALWRDSSLQPHSSSHPIQEKFKCDQKLPTFSSLKPGLSTGCREIPPPPSGAATGAGWNRPRVGPAPPYRDHLCKPPTAASTLPHKPSLTGLPRSRGRKEHINCNNLEKYFSVWWGYDASLYCQVWPLRLFRRTGAEEVNNALLKPFSAQQPFAGLRPFWIKLLKYSAYHTFLDFRTESHSCEPSWALNQIRLMLVWPAALIASQCYEGTWETSQYRRMFHLTNLCFLECFT